MVYFEAATAFALLFGLVGSLVRPGARLRAGLATLSAGADARGAGPTLALSGP
ncbi:hypothetical protein [Segniliparus rugosus]|uniref:hypothetical protein n=1 Tax=Segniliparus rugosus TaxID=286804 RepID=UPI0002FDD8C9|nr:hypothetical protein [Segniliparus rugosus]